MKWGFITGIFIGLTGGFIPLVFAAEEGTSVGELSARDFSTKSFLSVEVGTTTDSYVNASQAYFRPGASSTLSDGIVGLKGSFNSTNIQGKLDVNNRYSFTENADYVHPNEAYVGGKVLGVDWAFGRKTHVWSEADNSFHQGLFAPRYMEDKLKAEGSTLTGLSLEKSAGDFAFTVFASPFFVPDLGPQVSVQDQKFVSKNPWFSPPASTFTLNGSSPGVVDYSLSSPDVASVLFQFSFATGMQWENEGRFFRLNFADKPKNQMLTSFPFKMQTAPNSFALDVDIHERTIRHRLYNMEVGQHQEGGVHTLLSYTYEDPERDPMPNDWISQTVDPAHVVVGGVGYDIARSGPQATYAGLSFVRVFGGDGPDRGQFAQAQTLFERTYQYTKALKADFHTPVLRESASLLRTTASTLYDFDQRAMVFSTALEYVEKQVMASLSCDFLGLVDNGPANIPDGFLRNYRANDRVTLGLSYIF